MTCCRVARDRIPLDHSPGVARRAPDRHDRYSRYDRHDRYHLGSRDGLLTVTTVPSITTVTTVSTVTTWGRATGSAALAPVARAREKKKRRRRREEEEEEARDDDDDDDDDDGPMRHTHTFLSSLSARVPLSGASDDSESSHARDSPLERNTHLPIHVPAERGRGGGRIVT